MPRCVSPVTQGWVVVMLRYEGAEGTYRLSVWLKAITQIMKRSDNSSLVCIPAGRGVGT